MAFLDWLKNLMGNKPADTVTPPNTPPTPPAGPDQNQNSGQMQ